MQEPVITVGILSGKEIGFSFPKEFISSDGIAICGIQLSERKNLLAGERI